MITLLLAIVWAIVLAVVFVWGLVEIYLQCKAIDELHAKSAHIKSKSAPRARIGDVP